MPYYICNKNADDKGRHEVHTTSCNYLPHINNQVDIGVHDNCQSAIRHVQNVYVYHNFDGCYYCCPACHKG